MIFLKNNFLAHSNEFYLIEKTGYLWFKMISLIMKFQFFARRGLFKATIRRSFDVKLEEKSTPSFFFISARKSLQKNDAITVFYHWNNKMQPTVLAVSR